MTDQRQHEHGECSNDSDRGHGEAGLAFVGADHRCSGEDGRVPTDRATDPDQHGHPSLHPQPLTRQEREAATEGDGEQHEPERLRTKFGDRLQVQTQPQEDDPDA